MSCFICHSKLFGQRVQVCSNITLYSKTPFAEKICMLLGEELVVIVTPLDHMCLKCTSILNHLDKLHSDVKTTENLLVSYILKSYGILPSNEGDQSDEVVNEHLMTTEEQPKKGQLRVPHSLPTGVAHTITTDSVVTPIPPPSKLLKVQPRPLKPQPRQPQPPLQQPPLQQPPLQQPPLQQPLLPKQYNIERIKIYKCGFCAFQSTELPHVRFHIRSHKKNDKSDNPNGDEAAATKLATMPTLTPISQKKRLYRCQICSKTFDCRKNCVDHIVKDHNPPTLSTSSGPREDTRVTTPSMMPGPSKIQENNEQAETHMDLNKNQENKDSGTIDMAMMLNVPTKRYADVKGEKKSEKEEEEEAEAGGEENEKDTAVPKQADCETSDGNVENIEDIEIDIDSMLAAMFTDTTPTKIRRSKRIAS